MEILNTKRIYTVFILLVYLPLSILSQSVTLESKTKVLFDRLDSSFIDTVCSSKSGVTSNTKELLDFYRNRTTVKHPFNTVLKPTITEKDLKYANDALEHIFVGQPAYPSHFCGVDINWNSRPVPDNEWVWQLHRMYFWDAMGKVYNESNEERYAKAWCEQIVDWIIKNPRDQKHGYAWRSIEAGKRGQSWTTLFHQFLHSEHFTPKVLVPFMNSCFDHAQYLMQKYSSGSNWALMEAEGLAFIAFTFPEFKDAEKWKIEAIRRYNIEIDNQVYPDGHQRELSMGYHLGSIRWFYRTYNLAKLNGQKNLFPESYIKKLEKMSEIPMKLCLPDGTNAQFGDSWAGVPRQHNQKFMEWSQLFNRVDFMFLGSNGAKGIAPKETAYALGYSGLYSMRSDWSKEATCLVLKCGPDAGFHGQPDNGTFTLYAGGRTLMPDAGCYIYHGDQEWRNWFRQTKVHQTLTLNGKNTGHEPKLIKWETGSNLDILIVENAGYSDLTHRRSIFFVDKRYFVIVDEAIGTGIGNVDVHFQLAPGKAIYNYNNLSVRSDYKDGWNVFVRTNKQKDLELSEEEGWVSYEYTKKETRPAFHYRLEKTNPNQTVRFITVVAPYKNEIPDIEVAFNNSSKNASNSFNILVQENGIERTLLYEK
jgi:heparan-sulfate lyase